MKTLKIQFAHPVKGRIQLRKNEAKSKVESFNFGSDEDFAVEICLKNLIDGNWTASLQWEHNSQHFLIQRHFKIVNTEMDSLVSN